MNGTKTQWHWMGTEEGHPSLQLELELSLATGAIPRYSWSYPSLQLELELSLATAGAGACYGPASREVELRLDGEVEAT